MPELPDITLYLEALQRRLPGQALREVHITSPFLLRTVAPPVQCLCGRKPVALRRLGKRIAIGFEDEFWLVMHLMIAGRLHWMPLSPPPPQKPAGAAPVARRPKPAGYQAALVFENGCLTLTEAGTKRRASWHLVQGEQSLRALDPGGLEVLESSLADFTRVLKSQNHTLKRALTDPRLFSGIGNAYSDEILHAARLSPVALTQKLSAEQIGRLYAATRQTLLDWIERLRRETGADFPEKVTAFRTQMAVHGKYGQACPVCGATVQRIRYADNETNYCPGCQTGGKLLADRSLSLLLKKDWPKTLEELEEMRLGGTKR